MLRIFDEVFREIRRSLQNIVAVTRKYQAMLGAIDAMCTTSENQIACDLSDMLAQLMILRGMYEQAHYDQVGKNIAPCPYLPERSFQLSFSSPQCILKH